MTGPGRCRTVLALHHAGGSARSFVPLRRACPPGFQVLTHELAGQGRRRLEPRCPSVAAAAAEVAERIAVLRPDILFGVSLGAMVALEAVGPSRRPGHRPERVVLASVAPPSAYGRHRDLRLAEIGDAELAAALATSGRAPTGLLTSPWAAEALADLRANLTTAATHASPMPATDAALDVWLGQDDDLASPDLVAAWPAVSTGRVSVRVRPGDHLWPVDPARQDEVWRLLSAAPPTPPAG